MGAVVPSNVRYVVEDKGSSLVFTMRSRRSPSLFAYYIFFLGFPLCFLSLPYSTGKRMPVCPDPGWIILTGISLACLGYALYWLAWTLVGKEHVAFSNDRVEIQRQMAPLKFPEKSYELEFIEDFRADPDGVTRVMNRGRSYFVRRRGALAFDYGSKTVHFGDGVDEGEARQIIRRVVERFPHYSVAANIRPSKKARSRAVQKRHKRGA